jgi:hypothetical protein
MNQMYGIFACGVAAGMIIGMLWMHVQIDKVVRQRMREILGNAMKDSESSSNRPRFENE